MCLGIELLTAQNQTNAHVQLSIAAVLQHYFSVREMTKRERQRA